MGGEDAALERLRYYLWDSDLVSSYFDTRNGMLGEAYSTKFSSWLAHGCISPRLVRACDGVLPGSLMCDLSAGRSHV